jgi:hypothetical protein
MEPRPFAGLRVRDADRGSHQRQLIGQQLSQPDEELRAPTATDNAESEWCVHVVILTLTVSFDSGSLAT